MIIEAVVLKVNDRREYDRIITCYTRQLGKIDILVRSSRKISSKLVQFTSGLISLLDITITPGRNYYHLIGGTIKKYFSSINTDYEKSIQVEYIFKTIDEAIKPEKTSAKIFDLLIKTLVEIEKAPKSKIEIFVYAFLIKFLAFLGHQPEIKSCLICRQAPKDQKVYFDFNRGGLICQNCQNKKGNQQVEVTLPVLKILQNLLYRDFDFLAKQFFSVNNLQSAKTIIDKFLEWHLRS